MPGVLEDDVENMHNIGHTETEPLQQVTRVRARSASALLSSSNTSAGQENYDIEQNIREIRAILSINADIFDYYVAENIIAQGMEMEQDGRGMSFARHAFDMVMVKKNQATRITYFLTGRRRSECLFDMKPLQAIPADLDGIVALKYKSEPLSMFIDYELFFENSLNLHENVLAPFLSKLKSHLMDVQITLGKIETWVTVEPQRVANFLEATFQREKLDSQPDMIILKQCYLSGIFETIFGISHESEQRRLTKFLEFASVETIDL